MKTKALSLLCVVGLMSSCSHRSHNDNGKPAGNGNSVVATNSSSFIMTDANYHPKGASVLTISFTTSDKNSVNQFYVDTAKLPASWSLATASPNTCPTAVAAAKSMVSCVLSLAYDPKATDAGTLSLPISYLNSSNTLTTAKTPNVVYSNEVVTDGFESAASKIISATATSANGKYMAIASNDPNSLGVRLYKNIDGKGFQTLASGETCESSSKCVDGFFPAYQDPYFKTVSARIVSAVSFSPDGKYLAVGTSDAVGYPVTLYTADANGDFSPARYITVDNIFTASGAYPISAIAFSQDSQYMAIGSSAVGGVSDGSSVRLYKNDGTTFTTKVAEDGYGVSTKNVPISAIAFSADNKYLAIGTSAAVEQNVRLYTNLDGKGFSSKVFVDGFSTIGKNNPVSALTFSKDNKYLAVGSSASGTARLYTNLDGKGFDVSKQIEGFVPGKNATSISAMVFSPNSKFLAIGSQNSVDSSSVNLYYNLNNAGFNVSDTQKDLEITPPGDFPVSTLSFGADSKFLAIGSGTVGSAGVRVISWDVPSVAK